MSGMAQAALLSAYAALKAVHADAVVAVAVEMEKNGQTIETTGLRSSKTVARTIVKGAGLADNVDIGVWIPTAAITAEGYSVDTLRGKVCRIGSDDAAITQRILTTREHALGGLVLLSLGEYDRVTQ